MDWEVVVLLAGWDVFDVFDLPLGKGKALQVLAKVL